MARNKPRAPKRRIAGTYSVDSGTAEFIPDPARDGGYTLEVNRVPSSYVVVGAPRILGFDYMEWIAAALAASFPLIDAPLTLTHLGGAAASLPRYCADVWPRSRNLVVDIDGALCALAAEKFDVPAAPRVEFAVGDARDVLESLPAGGSDAVVRDVFAGPSTPAHVTTVEFFRAVAAALKRDGIYLANIGDRAGLAETRAELAGMLEVFPCVGVIATPVMLAGGAYGNVVAYGVTSESAARRILDAVPEESHRDHAWAVELAGGTAPRRD